MNKPPSLERVGFDDVSDRALFLLAAESASDLTNISIATGNRYFVALIAWDSRNESPAAIARLARMFLDAGCVYFCCWGPDCERVHDAIDQEYVGGGYSVLHDESTIMTTWHNDESLEESAWFALNAAFPDDRYFDECRSVVAVCIGNSSWAREISTALADPRALVSRVVKATTMLHNTYEASACQ